MAESAAEKSNKAKDNYYPHFVVKNNENPNRWLAIPFLGVIFKIIITIPVWLYAFILAIVYLVMLIILPFVILFTGKYWDTAYDFIVGFLKLTTKITLYIYGLTDKYPTFSMADDGLFELEIEKPKAPSKLLAFPLLGAIIRFILLIPYSIFDAILNNGSQVAVFFSWFTVLFKKKYPESLYEFIRDSMRVSFASTMYTTYMSDKYPNFFISMNHQTIKIILIVLGTLLMLTNFAPQQPSRYDNDRGGAMYDSTQDSTDTSYPDVNDGS